MDEKLLTATMDSPSIGLLEIDAIDFQGRYVTSPSGTWCLAVEIADAEHPVSRWALIRETTVRSFASADTHLVFAMAVADDATFVLARRTGRTSTKVEVRDGAGTLLVSQEVEAIAHSCVISPTGRWVAVGFADAKRGDEPILLIDGDKRAVYRRIPAKGGQVRSIEEERRVVIADDGEYEFGVEAMAPRAPAPAPVEPVASSWSPDAVYAPPVHTGRSPWVWAGGFVGAIAVIFFVRLIFVGLFVASAPAIVKGLGKSAVEEYEMTVRHGSKEDVCRAAGDVADFYLRTHNETQFAHWKSVEKRACAKAGH